MDILLKLGTLKIRLIIAGVVILVFFSVVFLIGVFSTLISDDVEDDSGSGVVISSGNKALSEQVEKYRSDVLKTAKDNDIEDQTDVLLALMMQESGGQGTDVFQASESKCGSIGCITDVQESIEQGVKYYAQQLKAAKGDIKLTLQSYNFGGGFINYALEHNGGYSKDIAIDFSKKQYNKLKGTGNYSCINPEYSDVGACYGDVEYVDHVLRYYHPKSATAIKSIEQESGGGGNGKWAYPIDGNPTITSPYGTRVDPINGGKTTHNGIDFACTGGVTPIKAAADGEVVFSEFNNGGFGNLVMVKHGEVYSHYAHMSDRKVEKGDKVKKGDQVGVCGSTGRSTGPHLHFEAKKPKENLFTGQIDPNKMLK